MAELLKLDSGRAGHVPIASEEVVARFNADKHEGPTLKSFVLDLDGQPSSAWNKAATDVFVEGFLQTRAYECTDPKRIRKAFKTYLKTLKKHHSDRKDFETNKVTAEVNTRDKRKAAAARKRRRTVSDLLVPRGVVSLTIIITAAATGTRGSSGGARFDAAIREAYPAVR